MQGIQRRISARSGRAPVQPDVGGTRTGGRVATRSAKLLQMSNKIEYEYAELVTGFFNRGQNTPVKPFMHVRDITGETVSPDFAEGSLGALNLLGAQGWRLITTRVPSPGRMGWIAAALKDDAIVWEKYTAEEFLLMRRVID